MEKLAVGSVILLKFPFSDLKNQKIRPVLILAEADFEDLIVCQISSRQLASVKSITISKNDLASGSLPVTSYARPAKLFTLSRALVISKAAEVTPAKRREVLAQLQALFTE